MIPVSCSDFASLFSSSLESKASLLGMGRGYVLGTIGAQDTF